MYKVRVPIDQPPRFPPQCALCAKEQPDFHYHLSSGNIFTDLFSGWQNRASHAECEVPACKACARGWAWRRRSQWIVMLLLAVALAFGMKAMLPMLPADWVPQDSKWMKWVILLAIILVGLPLAGIIHKLIPVPITLLAQPQYLEFQFRNSQHGMQFDDANNLIDVDNRFSALEEEDDFDQRLAELHREEAEGFEE